MVKLRWVDDTRIDHIDFPTGNYVSVEPPGTRSYLFATIKTWENTSTVVSVVGAGRAFYVIGESGRRIKNLQIRYWYMA